MISSKGFINQEFMEHKEAAEFLKNLMDSGSLTEAEKEAVFTAIGVLAWTSLAKSRIRSIKDKKDAQRK